MVEWSNDDGGSYTSSIASGPGAPEELAVSLRGCRISPTVGVRLRAVGGCYAKGVAGGAAVLGDGCWLRGRWLICCYPFEGGANLELQGLATKGSSTD
eukprot:Skav226055  [mRNA]  locus=scaffold211:264309:264602:- [translate_table: standard]